MDETGYETRHTWNGRPQVCVPSTNYIIKGEAFYVQCECLGFGEDERGRMNVGNCSLRIAVALGVRLQGTSQNSKSIQKNIDIFSGNSTSFNSEFFNIVIFSSWKRKQVPSCGAWSDNELLKINFIELLIFTKYN